MSRKKKKNKTKKTFSKLSSKGKNKKQKWLSFALGIIIGLVCLITIFLSFYQIVYSQKVYPGVKIGQINFSGKDQKEIKKILENYLEELNKNGLQFKVFDILGNKKEFSLSPTVISPADPDLSRTILDINISQNVKKIFQVGRQGDYLDKFFQRLRILFKPCQIVLDYSLDREELKKILERSLKDLEKPAQNAQLWVNEETKELEIKKDERGYIFNYDEAIKELEYEIRNLSFGPIELSLKIDYPKIREKEAKKFLNQAKEIAKAGPIKLIYQKKNWLISEDEIKEFLEIKVDNQEEGYLDFKENKLKGFLENIAQEIDVKARDAKFKMENGRVVEFQANQEGRKLAIEKNYQLIKDKIFQNREREVVLVVEKTKPNVVIADINNLGIRELIGRGESNFAGSPKNRRHNIAVGATALNGLLIKPGEEFSLLKAIGKVDASTGYLPELVIKGDRTIPEYGGGLCQIGTTSFRVALNTGLPITEREPHSYRVSYYEPAGLDATIYNPSPDLKFINDTGNYILWQSKIEGNNLIFEFWGTSDGRKVEVTHPRIYNITNPPPTKYIETEELEPGEEKCVERAHKGADTEFTRTIKYADGRVKKEVWKSHYKAWPEVCLVGKKPEEEKDLEKEQGKNSNSEEEDANVDTNINIELNE